MTKWYNRIGNRIKDEIILRAIKARKRFLMSLLTHEDKNSINVDFEVGIRISELDELIKLLEKMKD